MKKNYIIILAVSLLAFQTFNLYGQTENDMWLSKVALKTVVGNYIYTFKENGDVTYTTPERITKTVMFYKAESGSKAYYYGKIYLKDLVATSSLIPQAYDKEINLYIGFVIEGNSLKMTSNYNKDYYKRLENWVLQNSYNDGVIKENADWSGYPIPKIEEINFSNLTFIGNFE